MCQREPDPEAAGQRRLDKAGTTSEAIEQNLEQCLQFVQDAATTYRTASARIRRRMNQALFERILIEEDGTVVGQLAGPYRQLLDPDPIVPADKLTEAAPETEEELTEPQQEALFDPSAWSLGVPTWIYGQAAWQRRHTKKPPTFDVKGPSRGPGRDLSSAWGLKKDHVVHRQGLEPRTR